jgi:phage antirepressor YoqD-like protein
MVGKKQTPAERMKLIREAAKKFKQKQQRLAKFQREESVVLTEDERYWTDASKYAEEYYGDVYKATTKFDNDWGDY